MKDFYLLIGDFGLYTVVLSVAIVLWYELRLLMIRKITRKYEYASANEIRYFKTAALIFSVGIIMVAFYLIARILGAVEIYLYYFVGFVSVGIGIMIGYGLVEYFKVYYPFILERKLSRIRFQPRKSPKTGKSMRLLNELEEDAHLTQEMIDHEKSFTYDYDVWLDDDTGYKLIERFDGHYKALVCPKCNFRTLKDYKEDVVKSPSMNEGGVLRKHFKCSYCEHEETREIRIASLAQDMKLGVR